MVCTFWYENSVIALLTPQPKGADRKLKTDRDKMDKKSLLDKEKYQPSYDTTMLTEVRNNHVQERVPKNNAQLLSLGKLCYLLIFCFFRPCPCSSDLSMIVTVMVTDQCSVVFLSA